MEVSEKKINELIDNFEALKSAIEEDRDNYQEMQKRMAADYEKYMALRKTFEMLGIEYTKLDGDDQNAYI